MIRPRLGFRDAVDELVSSPSGALTDLSGCNRQIEGRLKPRNVEDVIRIVKAARRHEVRLHTFSCGKNWGFGSTLPVGDDAWLIDLSEMIQISDYDCDCGAVTIEPGVTQGSLFRTLRDLGGDWFFNITGAGQSTSVLGNFLERGIGYYGQRQLDLIDLQVVTGTGEMIWTRLARNEVGGSGVAIGTDLTHLFCQGTFGVVVGARLRLLRRTDGGGVVIARLKKSDQVKTLFDRVLSLKRDGCIAGVPHIGNRERIVTTMAPWLPKEHVRGLSERAPEWTAALPLLGRRELVETAAKVIEKTLGDICDLETIIGATNLDLDKANPSPVEQLQHLACGFPSNLALPSVQWSALGRADLSISDPEKTDAGLIQVTPAIRSTSTEIERILGFVYRCGNSLGLPAPAITVNIVDSLTTVLVITLAFARRDAGIVQGRARAFQNELHSAGFGFYRFGLIQGGEMLPVNRGVRRTHAKLKRLFDPHAVFSPSKYDVLFADPSRSRKAEACAV